MHISDRRLRYGMARRRCIRCCLVGTGEVRVSAISEHRQRSANDCGHSTEAFEPISSVGLYIGLLARASVVQRKTLRPVQIIQLSVMPWGLGGDAEAASSSFSPLIVLENRTHTSQKSIRAKGENARTNRIGEPRTACGMTFCCPRKKEPVATKKAKHIRHRWREILCVGDSVPRMMNLKSARPARRQIPPRAKRVPGPGGPENCPAGARACLNPSAIMAAAITSTIAQAIFSNLPGMPSRRRAVIHAVAT